MQECEKIILQSILYKNELFYQAERLIPEDFQQDYHQSIFRVICERVLSGYGTDAAILIDHFGSKMISAYITDLDNGLVLTGNIESHVQEVLRASHRRKIIKSLEISLSEARGQSENNAVLSATQARLMEIAEFGQSSESKRVCDFSAEFYDRMERVAEGVVTSGAITSGLVGLDNLTTGFHPKEYIVVGAFTGEGKCFGRGTQVLMFDGTVKRVEDVVIGDLVMGPDSGPRQVVRLGCGIDIMYRVTPLKGDSYVVTRDHPLVLRHTRIRRKTEVKTVTAECFHHGSIGGRHYWKGMRVGVEYPMKRVEVEPYYLGLWLGDGTSSKPIQITTDDIGIVDYLESLASGFGLVVRRDGKKTTSCGSYSICNRGSGGHKVNPLLDAMRSIGCGNGVKRIPHAYLCNDRSTRLSLLCGLIDSDGDWAKASKHYQITQKSPLLAKDIITLARSLGFAAYCSSAQKKSQRGTIGTYYRITISGDFTDVKPLLERKQPTQRKINKNVLNVGLKTEEIGLGEYFGFELAGPDRKFLLADFTVVHNSSFALQIIVANCVFGVKSLLFSQEMSKEAVLARMIPQAMKTPVPAWKVRSPRTMSPEERKAFMESRTVVDALPLWVNDTSTMHASELISHSHMMVKKHGIQLIVVDYLQLMKADGEKRYDQVSAASGALRELAKTLGVVVIAISQLARPEGKRKSAPGIWDLKASGEIENDAHLVLMPYRPVDKKGNLTGKDSIIIAKQREGAVGRLAVEFNKTRLRFDERTTDGFEEENSQGSW